MFVSDLKREFYDVILGKVRIYHSHIKEVDVMSIIIWHIIIFFYSSVSSSLSTSMSMQYVPVGSFSICYFVTQSVILSYLFKVKVNLCHHTRKAQNRLTFLRINPCRKYKSLGFRQATLFLSTVEGQ